MNKGKKLIRYKIKKPHLKKNQVRLGLFEKRRRRPTLPRVCSTIGAIGLNFSVRNGKRWNPDAITTGISFGQHSVANYSLVLLSFKMHFVKYQPSAGTPHVAGTAASFGQLVRLGFDIAVFTPASYQRHRLWRPSWGNLILWPASHLDAFSAYPIPTWIPGGAPGGTTGKPEVSPTRSSRTSVRATQISYAHDR